MTIHMNDTEPVWCENRDSFVFSWASTCHCYLDHKSLLKFWEEYEENDFDDILIELGLLK